LIAPRGSHSQGAGYTFFRRQSDGSIPCAELLVCAEQWLSDSPGFASSSNETILVVGYSSGAIFAEALLAVAPDRFTGAVLLRPEPIAAKFSFPPLIGMPILILAGRHDERRRPDGAVQLAAQLRMARADVTLHLLDTGHDWEPHDQDAVLARSWLAKAKGRLHADVGRKTTSDGHLV
jgi:phospholipase/carboxylesterase